MTAVFGRDAELALADTFLDAAEDRFSVLLFEGEAGIGKTTVWREVARRAAGRGFRVLSCEPAKAESELALSGLADLLGPVPAGALAALPDPQRRALDVALLRAEPGGARVDQRTLGTAVRSLLAGLSAEGPLLLAIDDVQWLDRASASVLAFALRRVRTTPLAWLFARRLPEPAPLAADGLVPPESLIRHALGPLTLAALHHLLKDRLRQSVSRSTLVRIYETSGGNPLFALEIARELGPSPSPEVGARLPVPQAHRDLLASRIGKLPLAGREALLAAAALSRPSLELVERVSSAESLAAAEETGLIRVDGGRVAFAHPLYAAAVYESASRRHRHELHRRLAELVEDLEERARHLALATAGPDEEVAGTLEEAAAQARSRGAWASAAELLERTRDLTPPDRLDDAHRRAIAAAEHHLHSGERDRGRTLLEGILAEPLARSQRADAYRLLAEISFHAEDMAGTARLLTMAHEHADEPRQAIWIELALAWMQPTFSDFSEGLEQAERALERAEATGDRALVAAGLALCAVFTLLCGRPVDWRTVERALELEDPDRIMPLMWRPSTMVACLHLWAGRYSEGRERLTRLRAEMTERGDESDLGFVLLWLAWLDTMSADLAGAATLADEMADLASLTATQTGRAFALAQRGLVHAHRGEVAETRRACGEAAALLHDVGNPQLAVWIAAAVGLLELSHGDPEAAWRACEAVTVPFEQQGIAEPSVPFFLPDALEALIALGRLDRAEALLDAFEARGRELDRAWAIATGGRCRALLLAARGELSGADAALAGALAAHERLEMPVQLARTLLVKGQLERRAKQKRAARESLTQALAIFERVGASTWAQRARAELSRVGLRPPGSDELTSTEARVADLAASGLTNREVAEAAFISPKTVEANLARVYRKLGIRSRAELGARMAERAGSPRT